MTDAPAIDRPEIQHQAKIICMQLLLLEGADTSAMREAIAKSVEFLAQSVTQQAA